MSVTRTFAGTIPNTTARQTAKAPLAVPKSVMNTMVGRDVLTDCAVPESFETSRREHDAWNGTTAHKIRMQNRRTRENIVSPCKTKNYWRTDKDFGGPLSLLAGLARSHNTIASLLERQKEDHQTKPEHHSPPREENYT